MRKREKTNLESIKRGTVVVFLITLVIVMGVTWLLNENQVKREKLKATYTAESTVSRVESQLSKYLAGMNGYLSKPIDSQKVFAILEEVLLAKSENL